MKIARPTQETFQHIIEFMNWMSEQLDALDDDYDMDAETFVSNLRMKANAVDHKIRQVNLICQSMIENLCDMDSKVLKTRPDIIEYLQAEEEKEKAVSNG